jgi:hypothetical protein
MEPECFVVTIMMNAKVSFKGKGSQFSKWERQISLKTYVETFSFLFLLMISEYPGQKNNFFIKRS